MPGLEQVSGAHRLNIVFGNSHLRHGPLDAMHHRLIRGYRQCIPHRFSSAGGRSAQYRQSHQAGVRDRI